MKKFAMIAALAGLLVDFQMVAPANEGGGEKPFRFARFSEDNELAKLETVIASYRNDAGVEVDLIGVVHIGDTEYYEALNEKFKNYDVLLYEMVGGKDDGGAAEQKKSALRFFQILYQEMMDLDFQMNAIDYDAPNFVHADMDWAMFSKRMAKKDENVFGLMSKAFEHQEKMRAEGKGDGFFDMQKMVEAIYRGASAEEIKLEVAKQFANMDLIMEGMEEGDGGSVLIGERNRVALEVLEKELKKGKKKLGLFYGAGHLPGMDEQLREEMGFEHIGEEWMPAWIIEKAAIQDEKKEPVEKEEVERNKVAPIKQKKAA
ncbi:MAG: hypothetical protein AAGA58_02355 [Verrucomicrobiota bacterium]